MPPKPRNPFDRFFDAVMPEPNSGCWLWTKHINPRTGYAFFRIAPNGQTLLAHRAAWEMFKGEAPGKWHVCHRCDVRSCVNPDHLFLGTTHDNMQDAAKKGRMSWKVKSRPGLLRGAKHPQAKLADDDIKFIRDSQLQGVELAVLFSVSAKTISRIRRREIWRHVL